MTPELLIAAGFPARTARFVFTAGKETLDKPEKFRRTYEGIRGSLPVGFFYGLVGQRRTYKTTIATMLAAQAVMIGMDVRYTTAYGFFLEIRDTYNKGSSSSELDVYNKYRTPGYLVIDEMDKRSEAIADRPEKPWEQALLYDLLDRRFGDCKSTLLIANQDKAQLQESLGPSLVARMNEVGGLIVCDWATI